MFGNFKSLVSWPIGCRVIIGFLQSLGSLGSLTFHLFLVSISFPYAFRDRMSMEFPRKHKWEKFETYNYVIKSRGGSCEWMSALINDTHWLSQLDFWVSSWITWINGSLIHFSLINTKHIEWRFISYTKFFLSLTCHYSIGFSQILIQILMKKLGIRLLKHQ